MLRNWHWIPIESECPHCSRSIKTNCTRARRICETRWNMLTIAVGLDLGLSPLSSPDSNAVQHCNPQRLLIEKYIYFEAHLLRGLLLVGDLNWDCVFVSHLPHKWLNAEVRCNSSTADTFKCFINWTMKSAERERETWNKLRFSHECTSSLRLLE